jgi:DNA-binding transcriptional LysR family regulator
MLNLHLVRIFTAVATQGSFTGAAEALHISQSAVSRAVRELERQVGMALVERHSRGVILTEAGKQLVMHARRIFALERLAELSLEELQTLQKGHLAIGASTTIGIYMLPLLLAAYHRRYPGIELFLDIGNTQQIVEHVLDHRLDVAYIEGSVDRNDLMLTPWREDELVVIAAPEHPLAQRSSLTVRDLHMAPFIIREVGSGTREMMEQAFARYGVAIQVIMELGSTEAIKQAVAAQLGISVVSRFTIQLELETRRLVVLPVTDLMIRRPLTCVRHLDRPVSRALDAWLRMA